ncbi:MAG TPA: 16S rRNA (cytosine(1402)-N(4))-methyltransferase RsmH [Burkholderiaceae bacterium]|nr:16S rRNA (cytosine(1402)-N(4))-methyltransferase RsmH [Burkholderiaceae bacterium]
MVDDDDARRAHRPVLLDACIDGLAIRPDGCYVDATFGRGGHSGEILRRLGPAGRLLAIDRDPEAIAVGREWGDRRFELVHARFSQIDALLAQRGIERIDGALLDLGVSSPQFDDPARGFSFRGDGPLDMRMDPTQGMSARQWLLQASEQRIAEVLRDYGEERFAVPLAKAIVARRGDAGGDAFQTTGELARLVADVVRRRQRRPEVGKDPATRTFQALRILVNQELEELEAFLERIVDRLAVGGRLAVISFHSLEDRRVKQFVAAEAGRGVDAPGERHPITGARLPGRALRLKPIARVLPDAVEIAANPRARSAVLRIAERI